MRVWVTSDLEIIHKVFVKQYQTNFMARKQPYSINTDEDFVMNLMFSAKQRWKRMRQIISSTFSPAKIKEVR